MLDVVEEVQLDRVEHAARDRHAVRRRVEVHASASRREDQRLAYRVEPEVQRIVDVEVEVGKYVEYRVGVGVAVGREVNDGCRVLRDPVHRRVVDTAVVGGGERLRERSGADLHLHLDRRGVGAELVYRGLDERDDRFPAHGCREVSPSQQRVLQGVDRGRRRVIAGQLDGDGDGAAADRHVRDRESWQARRLRDRAVGLEEALEEVLAEPA